jgi:hypothetical protein
MAAYPAEVVSLLTAKGFEYHHAGGGCYAWEKRWHDRIAYVAADSPEQGMQSSAKVELMGLQGNLLDAQFFPTFREALQFAEERLSPPAG